ncbi:MAG: hypoxanthine-guanine phosphoribosyltransferase [Chromatiales bacterium]|nr:hypoxanthine-guanine phosphoribosyltransferase [Chromatiales bacterium]
MSVTPEQAQQVFDEADCLYDRDTVEAAIEKMADAITREMGLRNPLVLSVMSGAMIPAGILLTHLKFPLHLDYIHATRYRGETSGGELAWRVTPRYELEGRVVLIIDDILDEGLTLQAIIESCRAQGATAVYSAVLVKKLHDRNVGVEADFVGLEVEDRYLFGYGMDYKEYWRNAPGIYAVKGM